VAFTSAARVTERHRFAEQIARIFRGVVWSMRASFGVWVVFIVLGLQFYRSLGKTDQSTHLLDHFGLGIFDVHT
jgi:hypothetical protein